MIRIFFRQYASWIVFLFLLQLLINALLFIDNGIPNVSFFYFNVIWLMLEISFLLFRYIRDCQVMKRYPRSEYNYNYLTIIHAYFEEQLQQKQMELQEKNAIVLEQQDELLAWVHEMKSPLTAMQLLIDQVEATQLKDNLENEWLRLFLLLDQQLHATRLMTIEQDNRLEKVNVKSVVVEEIKALRSWCFEKKISVELGDLDVEVITDKKWLGFIVRQILSNAVKYSHVGGQIQLFTKMHEGNTILSIQDGGIGIEPEDLPRVFRKSYTGTVGRETSAATGMGLYLAKQAAESLNIRLKIDSTVNKGTTVSLVFSQLNDYVRTLGM